jgi:hypothetical protein
LPFETEGIGAREAQASANAAILIAWAAERNIFVEIGE